MHPDHQHLESGVPALTVVIAAYNAAGTVGRAIQSAQLQTLADIEILVVDDHSEDNTAELVEGFARADARIRLLARDVNSGGVGAPRNDGVRAASGHYVMFLDADDELPNKACEELLEAAVRTGADLTVGRAIRVNAETGEPKLWAGDLHTDPDERCLAGIRDYPDLLTDPIAAGKLYRRDYLTAGGIRFPEGVFYEDTYFSTVTYTLATGITIIPKPVYRWLYEERSETPSITRRLGEIRSIADRVQVHRMADAFLKEQSAHDLKVRKDLKFLSHDLKLYMGVLRAGTPEFRAEFQQIVADYLVTLTPESLDQCGVMERIRAYCLRYGLIDAAVATGDYLQRRPVVASDVVERDGVVLWTAAGQDLPGAERFLDATVLGLHTAEFAQAKLFNQVTGLTVADNRVEITGEILNQFGRIDAKDRLKLIGVVRKSTGLAHEYPVDIVSVDRRAITYRAVIDITAVGAALKAGGRWNFLMQVLWNGRRTTTALCIRGHQLDEYRFTVGSALFEAYETVSGNLCMRTAAEHLELVAARKRPRVDWQWWSARPGVPAVEETPEAFTAAIVVPCHNAEATVVECLWSIGLQRGVERAQVILVDDGSTDGTAAILEAFAAYRANVTVIRKERGGAGSARNAALDQVTAPFVLFVDADDVLAKDALHHLLRAARKDRSDVAIGDTAEFPETSAAAVAPWKRYFGSGDRRLKQMADAPHLIFGTNVGNKLFRTEALRSLGLRFGEGVHFDEGWLVVPALLGAQRISLVDRHVCFERVEAKLASFLNSPWNRPQKARDLLRLNTGLMQYIAEDEDPRAVQAVHRFVVRGYAPYLRNLHKIMNRDELASVFPDVRGQYEGIPDELISPYVAQSQARLLHYAVRTGDLGLFCNPYEVPADRPQLYVDDAGLYRQLSTAATECSLLRVDRQRAVMEVAESAGGVLTFEGLLSMTGVDLAEPLHNRLELVLSSGRTEIAVPLRQEYRRDRWNARKQRDLYSGFHAQVDGAVLGGAPQGHYQVSVRINDGDRHVDVPVTARMSLHRYKGIHRVGGRRCELRVDAHEGLRLTLLAATAAGRLPAALRRTARQVRHSLPGRAGWRTRLAYWLSYPLLHHRNIWIIGERQDTAQDNALHLFRWIRENRPRRNLYYVIERTSPDWEKVAKYGNVLAHSSLRHRLFLLHATRLISPYDLEAYLTPKGVQKRTYLSLFGDLLRYRRVFLQHGVTYNDVSGSASRYVTSIDLMVTVAADEHRYIAEEFGYGTERVARTGFPRFDALQPVRNDRRILLMPTWRRDIVAPSYNRAAQPKIPFASSEYFRFFSEFLAHPRLLAALRHYGVTLEFFPHYEIRPYLHYFSLDHPSVEVADPASRNVQDALRECSLLVTDYSSVFFDVAYMSTPQVYVPFDYDEFYSKHYRAGYLNLLTDGFGPACRTVDDAVEAVIASMADGFVIQSPYRERVEAFFGPRDTRNSERVFDAIEALGSQRRSAPDRSPHRASVSAE